MNGNDLIAVVSIITAGAAIGIGAPITALGEGYAVGKAMAALSQQPDAGPLITRTLFIGVAMVESSAIYCFVVAMILIFANPFWNHAIAMAGGQ